jgi:PRTRC genetic system protein A
MATLTMSEAPALTAIFSGLVRHHIATFAEPLPAAMPGITWIWAANGIFKRGVNPDLDALIQVRAWSASDTPPGLASLIPHVRHTAWPGRLPGGFLAPLLENARRAGSGECVLQPIEKHYAFVARDDTIKVIAPPQRGTAGRVEYGVARGVTLLDLHSHHGMPAFFSATDDQDDLGLSVSAVIGHIFTRPEILVRINVYGQRQQVPALMIFDSLGPLYPKERRYASAAD